MGEINKADEVRAVLLRAADRLSKPGAWTQGEAARAPSGMRVPYDDPNALSWCVIGALMVETENASGVFGPAIMRLRKAVGAEQASEWNDAPERTAEEVVDALRKAAGES